MMKLVRSPARLALTLAVFGTACASSGGVPSQQAIARLEEQRAANPSSEPVLRSLGVAYYKADRLPDARAALAAAVHADPKDGVAALYLGMTAEKQEDLPAARDAYEHYLQVGKTRRVRNQVTARLAALSQLELRLAAKQAIAREQQLSATPGSPRTVAVMPLHFTGADTSLQPLERGFAELLVTDLARSSQLTVVERARLQALLDEMKLQRTAGDSSAAVRAGHIMQAGRIVQGAIVQNGNDLRVDAAVVNVQTASVTGNATDGRALDQLFTLEKNIALSLFDQLDVRLTTAERNAIEQRPTKSLQAFLAYSRGLEAQDRGQYDRAAREFESAVRIDPGFGAAQQKAQQAQQAAVGMQSNPGSIESGLSGSSEGQVAGNNGTGNTASTLADAVNPSQSGNATGGGTNSGGGNQSGKPLNSAGGADPGGQPGTVVFTAHWSHP